MALGYDGMGNKDKANRLVAEAQSMDINHQGISAFLTMKKYQDNETN